MLYGFIKKTRKNVLCPPLSTLLQHRALWVQEPASQRYRGTLQRLTGEEWGLFQDLCDNRLGEAVRLEQERVGYRWVQQTLAGIAQRCG